MVRLIGNWAVVGLLALAWFVTLRPAPLGGPAAFVIVSGNSMQPGLAPGDLVVARKASSYKPGDVIVYRVPRGEQGAGTRVIHRVIGGSPSAGFRTRGDNREHPDRWLPKPADIEGAKLLAVPGIGRAMTLLGNPLIVGALVAILAFVGVGDGLVPRRRRTIIDDVIASTPTPPMVEPPVIAEPTPPAPVVPAAVAPPRPVLQNHAIALAGVAAVAFVVKRQLRR